MPDVIDVDALHCELVSVERKLDSIKAELRKRSADETFRQLAIAYH